MNDLYIPRCAKCHQYFAEGVEGEGDVCDKCYDSDYEAHPFQPLDVLDDTADA